MSELEIKLFKIACEWKARYERSHPEVGIGPFPETIIKDIEQEAGVKFISTDNTFKERLRKLLY